MSRSVERPDLKRVSEAIPSSSSPELFSQKPWRCLHPAEAHNLMTIAVRQTLLGKNSGHYLGQQQHNTLTPDIWGIAHGIYHYEQFVHFPDWPSHLTQSVRNFSKLPRVLTLRTGSRTAPIIVIIYWIPLSSEQWLSFSLGPPRVSAEFQGWGPALSCHAVCK